jgi:hypothetical protein
MIGRTGYLEMQPDCGENPCTPNTLIRILPERVGEPTRRTNPFFFFCLRDQGFPHMRLEPPRLSRVLSSEKQERFLPC